LTIKYLDCQDNKPRRRFLSRATKNQILNQSERREALIEKLLYLGEATSTETAVFQQTAAAQLGLGVTDMKLLSILLREGPKTAGEIASRLGLTSGSVTTLIDRLEHRDLVRRQAHGEDRRKVVVKVNQDKLSSGENIYRSMGMAFANLLGSYTTEQLEFLVQFYETTLEITKKEIAKLAKHQEKVGGAQP
jgi:MarR family transcriptional regulator, organic hydroperoxide resistance regulator